MTWTITTDGNKTTWTAENGTTNTLTANADRTAWTWTRNKNGKVRTSISYPTEYKRTKEGQNPPNARESWIDVQARALYQAERLIMKLAKS